MEVERAGAVLDFMIDLDQVVILLLPSADRIHEVEDEPWSCPIHLHHLRGLQFDWIVFAVQGSEQ